MLQQQDERPWSILSTSADSASSRRTTSAAAGRLNEMAQSLSLAAAPLTG